MSDPLRIAAAMILVLLSMTVIAGNDRRIEPLTPIPDVIGLDQAKVQLGKQLFNDPNLSSDGSVSCASCHHLENAGVDGLALSLGAKGQIGQRNTPTVLNSSLLFRQFWDGRADSLEEQASEVLTSPFEMANDWTSILAYLQASPDYQRSFDKSYSSSINQDNVLNALANFQKSLLTPNGAFDRYLKGDDGAIDEQTKRGYQLFKAYGCVSCHQGVAVGGNMYEKLGVVIPYFNEEINTNSDRGRYLLSGNSEHKFEFKVPSLRNVARTAPYLHDGSIDTLEEVVSIMAKHQLGLRLSQQETADIVKFLQSLDGELNGQ